MDYILGAHAGDFGESLAGEKRLVGGHQDVGEGQQPAQFIIRKDLVGKILEKDSLLVVYVERHPAEVARSQIVDERVGVDKLATAGVDEIGTGCDNIASMTSCICRAIDLETTVKENRVSSNEKFSDLVTELNVRQTAKEIPEKSGTIKRLVDAGTIRIAGAVYDVRAGKVRFLED